MIFPTNTMLGELEMIKEYEYYDCPRLFTCKNEIGKPYIGLSVEDNDDSQVWLYASISPNRLAKAEKGEIDVRDVFLKAEEKFVLEVTTYNEKADTAHMMISKDIPETFLPTAGLFLNGKHIQSKME